MELLALEYLLMKIVIFIRTMATPTRRSAMARLKRKVLNVSAAAINPFRKYHISIEFSIKMSNPTNNINMELLSGYWLIYWHAGWDIPMLYVYRILSASIVG